MIEFFSLYKNSETKPQRNTYKKNLIFFLKYSRVVATAEVSLSPFFWIKQEQFQVQGEDDPP